MVVEGMKSGENFVTLYDFKAMMEMMVNL